MTGARRRFRFIKEIAEGGFGKVYLAEQLSADGFSRIVAIKLLHASGQATTKSSCVPVMKPDYLD